MSKELTVSQKLAAFSARGIDEATVRANVKLSEIRSQTKLDAAVDALVTQLNPPKPVEVPTVAAPVDGAKVEKLKASAGPGSDRGFRFGHVWMAHLQQGNALVLRPTKLEKVQATATHLGLEVDFSVVTQKELVTMIGEALDKQAKNA